MKHEKKILPEYFEKVVSGSKTYEFRLADWQCTEGDTLVLKEWDKEKGEYTGREIEKTVGYVGYIRDFDFFSPEDVEQYVCQIISLIN